MRVSDTLRLPAGLRGEGLEGELSNRITVRTGGPAMEQGAYGDWVTVCRRDLDSGPGTLPVLALLRVTFLKALEKRDRDSVESMGCFQKKRRELVITDFSLREG